MIEQSMFPNGTGRDLAKDPILSCDPRWKTNADMIADISLLNQPPPQTTQITPRNNGSQLLVFQRDNHV